MDLREYQLTAAQTSRLAHGGPHGAIAPMLGLASETGSILNVYKQYLRDGIDLDANRELLLEELGDLLWYTATVATACGLDLDEIAQANLARTRDLYATPGVEQDMTGLPVLDAGFPATERSPRRLVVEFEQREHDNGRVIAVMTMVDAAPNAFPAGPIPTVDGKELGYTVGVRSVIRCRTTPGGSTPTGSTTPSTSGSWPSLAGRPTAGPCYGSNASPTHRPTSARTAPGRSSPRKDSQRCCPAWRNGGWAS